MQWKRIFDVFRRNKKRKIVPEPLIYCENGASTAKAEMGFIRNHNGFEILCPLTLAPIKFKEAALLYIGNSRYVFYDLQCLVRLLESTFSFKCPITRQEMNSQDVEYLQRRCVQLQIGCGYDLYNYSYKNRGFIKSSLDEQTNRRIAAESVCDAVFSRVMSLLETLQENPYKVDEDLYNGTDTDSVDSDGSVVHEDQGFDQEYFNNRVLAKFREFEDYFALLVSVDKYCGRLMLQKVDKRLREQYENPLVESAMVNHQIIAQVKRLGLIYYPPPKLPPPIINVTEP